MLRFLKPSASCLLYQKIEFILEKDAFFDGGRVYYIDGWQTELMTIRRELRPNR